MLVTSSDALLSFLRAVHTDALKSTIIAAELIDGVGATLGAANGFVYVSVIVFLLFGLGISLNGW
jgi:hypothetical protein